VLAIGLLVDDAIVVVENVEAGHAGKKDCRRATRTRKSMGRSAGALVGIGLVLSGRVPVRWRSSAGSTGRSSAVLPHHGAAIASVLVRDLFTPALCATLLKPPEKGHHEKRGFFGWFNRHFVRGNRDVRAAAWYARSTTPDAT